MNAFTTRFGIAPLLLALLVALAAVIGWETGWGRRVTRAPELAPVPPPQPVALSLLPDYAIEGGAEARRETVERPAFVPTRRPAPAPVQEAVKPRMQKGQFLLTGTAVVDKKAIAFLRETAGGKARSVRAGESINGLTVAEVKADRIRLTLGDEIEELVLKVAAGPRQTIQPPQPSVPGAVPGGVPGARPGVPAVVGQPVAGAPAPQDSDAQILERRRAARAQLAAEAAARAAATGDQPPRPVSPNAVLQPTPAPGAPPAAAAPANAPDPAWADVYRRMQQPRR